MSFKKIFLDIVAGSGLLIAAFTFCFADEGEDRVEFMGSARIESGQLMNYKFGVAGKEFNHQWLQDNIVILGLKTKFHPRLEGAVAAMGWLYFATFPDSMVADPARDIKGTGIAFNLNQANMTLNLSPNPEESLLKLQIGLFPFKYNHEVRNLGEYLFRTGCYPGYIIQEGFDMADAQLSGIRLGSELFDMWRNDLFLTTELYYYPLNDFSLTYLTNLTLKNKVLDIGAAVQFYRCFPVNKNYTQPKTYVHNSPGYNSAPNYYFEKDDDSRTDTLWYTFAGTKIMARFTFDPKPLFPGLSIFGEEDLKLYTEAIILGVKNYPENMDTDPMFNKPINEFGYDKLGQKMPIMVGFNFPTFKLLDVLALEVEYYGKKYVNRVPVITQGLTMTRLPLPYDPNLNSGEPQGSDVAGVNGVGNYYKKTYFKGAAQWKWSVYLKRTFFDHFSIIAQAARDHKRIQTTILRSLDQEEALIKDKQWYWKLKFGYDF